MDLTDRLCNPMCNLSHREQNIQDPLIGSSFQCVELAFQHGRFNGAVRPLFDAQSNLMTGRVEMRRVDHHCAAERHSDLPAEVVTFSWVRGERSLSFSFFICRLIFLDRLAEIS